jgi:hypothetical protein
MMENTMARAIRTPAQRIDQMLRAYAELNREAHDLMDLHVAELVATHPGVPSGTLKQCEFTNRAGSALNIPEALRLLRKKFHTP